MKLAVNILICLLLMMFIAGMATSQELIIYPNKGQSEEQLEKDKFECYSWAKKQTGFDPMQLPKATEPPPQQTTQSGGGGRSTLGGAAVGGAIGSTRGEFGRGAAVGAAAGGVIGGLRRRSAQQQQKQAEQKWAQQQAQNYVNQRNQYNRAYGACLEGRDYTVK